MNWLKKAVRLNFVFVLLSISIDGFAWSAKGHEWIAEKAFERLSKREVQYYQQLVDLIDVEKKENSPEADRNNLPLIASYPDRVRDISFSQLFLKNETLLPKAFIHKADNNTSAWHYHNEVVRTEDNAHCRFQNRGELLTMLDEIDKALGTPLTKKQEALLISFQIHLIQDLHQPLHSFTKLSDSCESDLGGNKTCYRMGFLGRCKTNLHALWDSGFDVFRRTSPVSLTDIFLGDKDEFLPALWNQENQRYSHDVYDISYADYFERSQVIAKDRIDLAVSRLAYYLKLHHKRKTLNASK